MTEHYMRCDNLACVCWWCADAA